MLDAAVDAARERGAELGISHRTSMRVTILPYRREDLGELGLIGGPGENATRLARWRATRVAQASCAACARSRSARVLRSEFGTFCPGFDPPAPPTAIRRRAATRGSAREAGADFAVVGRPDRRRRRPGRCGARDPAGIGKDDRRECGRFAARARSARAPSCRGALPALVGAAFERVRAEVPHPRRPRAGRARRRPRSPGAGATARADGVVSAAVGGIVLRYETARASSGRARSSSRKRTRSRAAPRVRARPRRIARSSSKTS